MTKRRTPLYCTYLLKRREAQFLVLAKTRKINGCGKQERATPKVEIGFEEEAFIPWRRSEELNGWFAYNRYYRHIVEPNTPH
jgi:hypothetical protein